MALQAVQAAAVIGPFLMPPTVPTLPTPAPTSTLLVIAAALQIVLGAAATGPFSQERALHVLGAVISNIFSFVLSLLRTSN